MLVDFWKSVKPCDILEKKLKIRILAENDDDGDNTMEDARAKQTLRTIPAGPAPTSGDPRPLLPTPQRAKKTPPPTPQQQKPIIERNFPTITR